MIAMRYGVDLSRWDGDVSIQRLRDAGVEFVICKVGGGDQGLYRDSLFERNYRECVSNGMPVGAYWYSAAFDEDTARREAEHCLGILNGRHLDYPVWMDVEEREHQLMSTNEPGRLGRIISAFCDTIISAGYKAGVYSWKWLLDPCGIDYDRWVCSWTKTKPSGRVDIWQFGGETNELRSPTVAGYGCMDQSYCFRDYVAENDLSVAHGVIASVAGHNTLVWVCGDEVHDLTHPDDVSVLDTISIAFCGSPMARAEILADEYARLCQSRAGLPKHLSSLNDRYMPRS
jgi:hypothetical protein